VLGRDYEGQDCALARALEVIGERWTLLIVRDAFYGVRRFNDFQAHLDIPKAVLSDRLGWLVENEVLTRRRDPNHGARHVYELTPAGRDLWPALHALLIWGSRHRAPNSRIFKHASCGSALDDAGHCASCDTAPAPEDILVEPRRGRRSAAKREDPVSIVLRTPHRLLEPIEL
jgi:DNA-binding HxlR family transcriptional regulator